MCKAGKIFDFINALPERVVVGERGIKLSEDKDKGLELHVHFIKKQIF